jgi:hypothetical protein
MKTVMGEILKYSLEDLQDRQKEITQELIASKTNSSIVEESSLQERSLQNLIKLVNRVYD